MISEDWQPTLTKNDTQISAGLDIAADEPDFQGQSGAALNSYLPATDTVAPLELLNPCVPKGFISDAWPQGCTDGRRREHTATQRSLIFGTT